MVETADGNVRGFVGALRFFKDTAPPICPECGVPMVPVPESVAANLDLRLLCARQGGYVDRAKDWCNGHSVRVGNGEIIVERDNGEAAAAA